MRPRALVLWSELATLEAMAPSWTAFAAGLPTGFRVGIEESLRESDRRLRLLGRLLLAQALARLGAAGQADLSFDGLGRPHLTGALDPSISHTDGLACAAVGVGCRIGVDVEALHPIEPSLYDRILAPGERRGVIRSENPDAAFLGFWTMKEAAAKADGRGLQLDPRQLLCREGSAFRGAAVRVEAATYRIRPLPLPAGWIGHLAHDAPRPVDLTAEAYSFS